MRIYERLTPLNARERRFAEKHHALLTTYIKRHNLDSRELIIPGLFEPPVRTLRAAIPENKSHIFR